MDNLAYTYTGNRLTALKESERTSPSEDIYLSSNDPNGTYAYDANGNQLKDTRKGLEYSYNCLDLLSEVKRDNQPFSSYLYSADGTKLGVRNADGSSGYDYVGSLIYRRENGFPILESALFADGRLKPTGANYTLTDHLGSVRAIVDANGAIQEQNDYYPFGSKHVNTNYADNGNRYKFSGKERQDLSDLNRYDFGVRMYDSDIARWATVDPLAEDYYSQSLFGYCGNNPIGFTDPFGMDYWSTNDPVLIAMFFDALQGQSNTKNWFDAFDYSSWTHVADKELLDNLVYNDETGMYYFSYVTKLDGDYACVGVSVKSPRKVLPKISGWWDTVMYGLNGRTYSTTATLTGRDKEPYTVPISYKVNMKGEIIGYAPNTLKAPDVGKKGLVYIKGWGNVGRDVFHSLKTVIINEPAVKNILWKVGANPDIVVKNGEIFLKQRKGNSVISTGLKAIDFLE